MAKTIKKRKFVDWDSIEPLYRAGAMSLNDICNQYAADHVNSQVWNPTVTHTSIRRKAKEKKWAKNLAGRVSERVKEQLSSGLGSGGTQTDEEIIEAAAKEPVEVALGQRARTHRLLKDQDDLAAELREEKNKKKLDVMARVRGFKDIAAAVKSHHADQAAQYNLNGAGADDKKCFEDWYYDE